MISPTTTMTANGSCRTMLRNDICAVETSCTHHGRQPTVCVSIASVGESDAATLGAASSTGRRRRRSAGGALRKRKSATVSPATPSAAAVQSRRLASNTPPNVMARVFRSATDQ
ncbi:MAG: hypothetical protein IPG88_12715 [Gemmatimonadetes bacterium]|nr:hypothetical protein [Gemmatimonadota bacterium]